MILVIGLGGWLIGAVATNAAQRVIGLKSPLTYGDSFSGDDTVDLICIVAWPIFWPCWLVNKLAERAMRRNDDRIPSGEPERSPCLPASRSMIDAAEANIREDFRGGTISKEQFQKEMLIVARARQQATEADYGER